MSKFILSTDSCCDIMKSETDERGIYRIALSYTMEKDGKIQTHKDEFDNDADYLNFYQAMADGAVMRTSQLTIEEHKAYFEEILKKERCDVVHITLSGGLSGTFDQAVIASKILKETYPDYGVYVVDSASAAAGQMVLVDEAEKMREEGLSAAQAKEKLDRIKMDISHWIVVDDLNHLKRGGRISGAKAAIGTLLNLKPFIGINHDGRLVVIGKNKGMKKSIDRILSEMKNYSVDLKGKRVYVVKTSIEETADELKKAIEEKFGADVKTVFMGPVISAHTGPGTIAAAYLGKDRISLDED